MATAHLDLSELDSVDLAALRLGAQVMSYKADLAARPRVDVFFKGLQRTVDEEVARRKHVPDDKPLIGMSQLPLAELAPSPTPVTDEDRRLAAELLDLMGANERLSPPVRHAVRTLREQLGPDY
jgi:hypothetical protein